MVVKTLGPRDLSSSLGLERTLVSRWEKVFEVNDNSHFERGAVEVDMERLRWRK